MDHRAAGRWASVGRARSAIARPVGHAAARRLRRSLVWLRPSVPTRSVDGRGGDRGRTAEIAIVVAKATVIESWRNRSRICGLSINPYGTGFSCVWPQRPRHCPHPGTNPNRPSGIGAGRAICCPERSSGACGRATSVFGKDYRGCRTAKHGGCRNTATIWRGNLESHVLAALGRQPMRPDLLAEFIAGCNDEWRRLTTEASGQAEHADASKRSAIERRIANLVDAIADGRGQYRVSSPRSKISRTELRRIPTEQRTTCRAPSAASRHGRSLPQQGVWPSDGPGGWQGSRSARGRESTHRQSDTLTAEDGWRSAGHRTGRRTDRHAERSRRRLARAAERSNPGHQCSWRARQFTKGGSRGSAPGLALLSPPPPPPVQPTAARSDPAVRRR